MSLSTSLVAAVASSAAALVVVAWFVRLGVVAAGSVAAPCGSSGVYRVRALRIDWHPCGWRAGWSLLTSTRDLGIATVD